MNKEQSNIIKGLTLWLSKKYNYDKSPMENIIGDFENAKTKHEEIRNTIQLEKDKKEI